MGITASASQNRSACLPCMLSLLCVLFTVGCSREDDPQYPEEVRTNFIASCIQAGRERDYCECSLEELERMLAYQEFQQLETDIISGKRAAMEKMSVIMENVVAICKPQAFEDSGTPMNSVEMPGN